MKVEYRSHELIEPEDMYGTPPDFPCVIIRVWYTRKGEAGRGCYEYPLPLKKVNVYKAERRNQYILNEIELAIKAGKESFNE